MTKHELAQDLATLEGVEGIFGIAVTNIVEDYRREATNRILRTPGMTPMEIVEATVALDEGLRKFESNIRDQYGDFYSAYVGARAAAFTTKELSLFVSVLRDSRVLEYIQASLRNNAQLTTPVSKALSDIVKRSIGG